MEGQSSWERARVGKGSGMGGKGQKTERKGGMGKKTAFCNTYCQNSYVITSLLTM